MPPAPRLRLRRLHVDARDSLAAFRAKLAFSAARLQPARRLSVAQHAAHVSVRADADGDASPGEELAQALHGLPPDTRRSRFDEIAAEDRHLGERVARMMRNDELMAAEGGDALSDESAVVRASEEGFEWEILTGPPSAGPAPEETGEERAGPPGA